MAAAGGSVNVEIGATFASSFGAVFGSADANVKKLGATVAQVDSRLSRVKGFQSMRQHAIDAEGEWRKLDAELRSTGQHLAGLGHVTDKQAREFKALEKRTEAARLAMEKARVEADRMERELADAGVDTRNLTTEQQKLERQLAATTNRMKALAGVANSGVGKAFSAVGSEFRSLATQATVAGAGLGYFFKKNFIDVAANFERMRIQLTAIEGSSEKAEAAMKWIQDFAKDTPLELEDTTKAFIQMRAFGMDPMDGSLKAIVDQVSKLGGGAEEVEGIILQLGQAFVKGKLQGDDLKSILQRGVPVYDMLAKRMGKTAAQVQDLSTKGRLGRKEIKLLIDEMGKSSAGASDAIAKTWDGLISKAGDVWTAFANDVMAAGLFDFLKGKLEDVFATLERMEASGELKIWAEQTGAAIKDFLVDVWELGRGIATATKAVADFVGGWKNLGILLVAFKVAPLVFAVGKLAFALGNAASFLLMFATGAKSALAAWAVFGSGLLKFGGLAIGAIKAVGAFLLANPIGAAIGLLVAAGVLLWRNWEGVKGGLLAIWEDIQDVASSAAALISGAWQVAGEKLAGIWTTMRDAAVAAFDGIKGAVGAVIDWLASKLDWLFAGIDKVKSGASAIRGGVGEAWQGAKRFVGIGDTQVAGPVAAPAGSAAGGSVAAPAAAPAPVSVVPAAASKTTINNTSQPTYNINVTGSAGDPRETAKAIRAEMDRRERERAAARRGLMTDALGY